jgi:hypothetical protein
VQFVGSKIKSEKAWKMRAKMTRPGSRMMQMIWIGGLAVLAAIQLTACSARRAHTNTPSQGLIVLPGAKKVINGRFGPGVQVSYQMKAAYPAKTVIDDISRRLAKLGWTPVMDKSSSHVRGWTSFFLNDTTTHGSIQDVWQWSADWKNRDGEMVEYGLRYTLDDSEYTSKSPPPGDDTLLVHCLYLPAEAARQYQSATAGVTVQVSR